MPIEMPKGLPFSVDTWTPCSNRKRHRFLTHAHKDHSQGISTHASFPIYATRITKTLTLNYYPQLNESLFVEIEIGQSIAIDDPVETFTVTAFDANHCPGAVMFLFEGTFGNILHTGDCRLTPECLQRLPEKYLGKIPREPKCRLDYVFLDCTFGSFSSKMPSKHVGIRQVIDCIWKHPDACVVYLTCDLLGQEEILVNVCQTFGSKIFVDKENYPECFQSLSLIVPDILSQDPSSRFHIFDGFPRLPERAEAKLAEARANFQPEPLIIRPSAQWYVFEGVSSEAEKRKNGQFKEATKDQFGIWHVCYSIHSSRDELEWALKLLAPRWVVSTTPECRAMELSYVKSHCSYSNLASDDPLWKLLDIDVEAPFINEDVQDVSISSSPSLLERSSGARSESSQSFVSNKEILTASSPGKKPSVTLFGRARLGLGNSTVVYEELVKPETTYQNEYIEVQCKNEVGSDRDVSEGTCDESKSKELTYSSPSGLSKGVGENIRKLYRGMHVPVPKPLPSLVDLLNDIKRSKRKFMS
ncbi:protein artemis isoform X1 [Cynara cardunculus var. scolymus]|uniref:protein artemis isoform X1 n=2 Tax=Cynara cardunculus var. scolymus TaxID=59895 RepID=UPI000D627947|nr:protein artemis isoform X1 [Cynara cardunculus var. scolymus]